MGFAGNVRDFGVGKNRTSLLLALLGGLLFLPFLGGVHLFDWDEINFAECAREMLINRDFGRVYIGFLPFWEKPPFFIWLQALSMSVFGVGDFAARFPNAVCGMVTLVLVYRLGSGWFGHTFGLLWALAFCGSVLPQLYFHSGIIDPWFNLFIFSALMAFLRGFNGRREAGGSGPLWPSFALSGLLLGLALLTKGPAALLLFGLTIAVRWAILRFSLWFRLTDLLVFFPALALFAAGWALFEYAQNGSWFIREFITYNLRLASTEDAGHGGFPGYHVAVLLLGCFPASFFYIWHYAFPAPEKPEQREVQLHLNILFWVVLVVFSLVRSKIVHYSSLCYFPLTFGAARAVHEAIRTSRPVPVLLRAGVLATGLLLGLALSALPWLTGHVALLRPLFARDPFALANLDTVVHWDGWEWMTGLAAVALPLVFSYRASGGQTASAVRFLFSGFALLIPLILWGFIGRIEAFSQGTAIGFFKTMQGRDAYVLTHNYRSYAHLYYTRLPPALAPPLTYPRDVKRSQAEWQDSLLRNPVDRDVYLITKINRKAGLDTLPGLELQWERNGWSVWKKNRAL